MQRETVLKFFWIRNKIFNKKANPYTLNLFKNRFLEWPRLAAPHFILIQISMMTLLILHPQNHPLKCFHYAKSVSLCNRV
jgi:hypothetical protein